METKLGDNPDESVRLDDSKTPLDKGGKEVTSMDGSLIADSEASGRAMTEKGAFGDVALGFAD